MTDTVQSRWVHAGWGAFRHAATILLIVSLFWGFVKPSAQEFIEDAVNDRLNLLELQMNDVRQGNLNVQREQAVMGEQIKNLKETAADTKRDTRMILQTLQQRERRGQ